MTIAGVSVLGMVLFSLGGYMLYLANRTDSIKNPDRALKLVVWMFFFGGFCITGGVVTMVDNVFGKAGTVGGHLFGVGATLVLTLLGLLFLHQIWLGAHPQRGKVERRHPYMAALTPIVLGLGIMHPIVVSITSTLNGDVSTGLTHWMGS